MSLTFPSDQHVAIVVLLLLGIGLEIVAFRMSDIPTQTACISAVAQIASGLVGFLGGRATNKDVILPSPTASITSSTETTTKETVSDKENSELQQAGVVAGNLEHRDV